MGSLPKSKAEIGTSINFCKFVTVTEPGRSIEYDEPYEARVSRTVL